MEQRHRLRTHIVPKQYIPNTSNSVIHTDWAINCAQIGAPTEEEIQDWAWHSDISSVQDEVLHEIGGEHVSFVFSLTVDGMPIKEQCGITANHTQPAAAGAAGSSKAGPSRCAAAATDLSC